MNDIIQYFRERFPLPQVLLFAGGYALLVIGVLKPSFSIIDALIITGLFSFFLLRQRITDEFKDADHDQSKYPDRPVPRGLVTRRQLYAIGLIAVISELILAFIFGGATSFPFYLGVIIYSVFMAREFFVSSWLDRHFTLYYISHEIIFVWFALFFASAFAGLTVPSLLVLIAAPSGVEIIRKFKLRRDTSGNIVSDTYPAVWGRYNSLAVLCLLSLVMGLSFIYIYDSLTGLLLSVLLSGAWIAYRKSDKAAFLIGVVNFIGFGLLSNVL